MANDREVTLEMMLPHSYRIVRYGDSDSLELENKITVTRKDGTREKEWKFVGYHSTFPTAIKHYLRHVPTRKLKGKTTIQDYIQFLKEIKAEINDIIPKDIDDWNDK